MDQGVDVQIFRCARKLVPDDGLPLPYGGSLIQAYVPAHDQAALTERAASLPRLPLTSAELFDLELIASGAFSPLTGFMTSKEYDSVLRSMALPDGRPWGLPVTLSVSGNHARVIHPGMEVALYYGEQAVGIMWIEDLFPWVPDRESGALDSGQTDMHIGDRHARSVEFLAGGPVALLAARGAGYMQATHAWPLELRSQFLRHDWRHISVPHVYSPWRRTDEYLLKCALEGADALLLHAPAVPDANSHVLPPDLLASASRLLVEGYFPAGRVFGNPVPAAVLASTPRAMLMHAILGQNYGIATLHIPEPADDGELRELFRAAARYGLSVRPVFVPAAFHCEPCGGVATGKSCPHDSAQRVEFSDQQISEQLQRGEALSPLVTRPDITRFLAREMAGRQDTGPDTAGARHLHPHASEVSRTLRESLAGHRACVLWMTGLSGSGKSTIAHRLERDLLLSGHRVFVLDGDTLRHGLNHDLGFSEADRRENLRRAAEVVKVMVEAGLIVIASFISPFRTERAMVREIVGASFHEVHVDASLEACEQRDPKGLYKRARSGQIPQFTGISSPYESPEAPDLRIDTVIHSVESAVHLLRDHLAAAGVLREGRGRPQLAAIGQHRTGRAFQIQ